MKIEATHLVILGSHFYDAEGVAVVDSGKDPGFVRELAVHSASAEMAVPALAKMCGVVAKKFGPKEQLHPFFHDIQNRIQHAADLLKEAADLNNYDRGVHMGYYPPKKL